MAAVFPVSASSAVGASLRVGGLERFSLVDWPGRMVATVFLQGCAWRCRYCHNPDLLAFESRVGAPAWEDVLGFLRRRRGLLDGVVFSGGEPTLQPVLVDAVGAVRDLGFRVGLHTGGVKPDRFARLLPSLDWVGFDVKAPFSRYAAVVGRADGEVAEASLRLLLASGVAHEIRTTWHPAVLTDADLVVMAETLRALGVRRWVVQRFRWQGCADAELLADESRSAADSLPPALASIVLDGFEISLR